MSARQRSHGGGTLVIYLRRHGDEPTESLALTDFERQVGAGEILPDAWVCFPPVTGQRFVPARELELFRGLFAPGLIAFERYFHFGRFPWLTLAVIALLFATYYLWQGGNAAISVDILMAQGAKSPALIVELGQGWRLLSANLLHVSFGHLALNCLFLFNLGGPAESVFRRVDYVWILIAGALGTTILSSAFNPSVTCGASGIVFGVWGATAVFGLRYRRILPERYRRYFIGMVVPYALFALYLGFATQGVDAWGHCGGLLAGCAVAAALPPRLLQPADRFLSAKLGALALLGLLVGASPLLHSGAGPLVENRYAPVGGLVLPLPAGWPPVVHRENERTGSYAFDNGAGVVVGLETRLTDEPVDLEELFAHFVTEELGPEIQRRGLRTMRLGEPTDATVAGLPAKHIRAELFSNSVSSRADYWLVARGFYRYVISFNVPIWLGDAYDELFDGALAQARLTEPEVLLRAKRIRSEHDSPDARSRLAWALAYSGRIADADQMLDAAARRWPGSPTLLAAHSRLLWRAQSGHAKACTLMQRMLQSERATERTVLTPQILAMAVEIFEDCGDRVGAAQTVRRWRALFPGDPQLAGRTIDAEGIP